MTTDFGMDLQPRLITRVMSEKYTNGRVSGYGVIGDGFIERDQYGIYVHIGGEHGRSYRQYVDVVEIGLDDNLSIKLGGRVDVTGRRFKLENNILKLQDSLDLKRST